MWVIWLLLILLIVSIVFIEIEYRTGLTPGALIGLVMFGSFIIFCLYHGYNGLIMLGSVIGGTLLVVIVLIGIPYGLIWLYDQIKNIILKGKKGDKVTNKEENFPNKKSINTNDYLDKIF